MINVCKQHHLPLACALEKNEAWAADGQSPRWMWVAADFYTSTGIHKTPSQMITTVGRVSAQLWALKSKWKEPSPRLFADALDSSHSWGCSKGDKEWAECARAWQSWTGITLSPDEAYDAYFRDIGILGMIKAAGLGPAPPLPQEEAVDEPEQSRHHLQGVVARLAALVSDFGARNAELEAEVKRLKLQVG